MNCWRIRALALALICAAPALFALSDERWSFISNDYVRLGVITNYGATIGHFSLVSAGVNFVNYMDAGRMIQQSYYGDADGSYWPGGGGNPWHWNPVQGGSYLNDKPALLAFSNVNNRIYARVHPRNWAGRQLLTNVVMEEWIDLTGQLAHIVFKMTYTGPSNYAACHQEVPAAFLDAAYSRLTYYDGPAPWSGGPLTNFQPAGVNNYDDSTERWWAYVNAAGYGMGIMTPATTFATYYWINGSGNEGGGCSYVSPIQTFAITPNFSYQYDVYLTIGTTNELRARFAAARSAADGHWTAGSGVWTNPANWIAGFVAHGAGAGAYFTNAIAADASIFPYAPQTIGNIIVNDADGSGNIFSIRDGSNDFTLAGAGPTINCATRLNLLPVVGGTQGFTKLGGGILNLGLTSNSISGPVNLYQGSEILLNHFQALQFADVTVTGTLVKSRKIELNAKSLTVGQDGKVDTFQVDTFSNVPARIICRDSITVNSGGQLGAGLTDGIQGQPFALLAPAITVNANGRIIVKNNMTATSSAEPGISGSNITVNSNGEIQFVYNGGTYVINNPLTLAGDGFWFDMGALHTQGNDINLTNNGPITLAGDTRIGQYGVGGYMDIRGNITGTGALQLWAQAASADHWKYFDLHGACLYNGALVLQTFAASSRTTLHNPSCLQANQVFVMSSAKFAGSPCIVELDLNGHSNTSKYLSAGGDGIKVIRDSSGGNGVLVAHNPSNYCIGVENGGTLRLDSGNVRCPVYTYIRDNSFLVLTGGYFEIGAELLAGHAVTIVNSTGTVTVAGGTLNSYVVRNGDVNGVGIINLNGGALRMAAMHTSSATFDGSVNFNGGILSDGSFSDWNGSYANWIQNLTKLYVQAGGALIEVNNSNGRTLLNGLLHDAALGVTPDGGLVKLGSGPLTLSGINTYTGPTIISNGTLRVNGSVAASSGVSVHGGAVGGTGTLAVTTIAAAGILAPGNSVGTLTVNGLTLQSNATNEWEKGAGVDNTDETVVNGNLTINNPVVVRVLPLSGATPDGATNPVFTVSGTLTGFSNLQLDLSATPGWSGTLVQFGNNVGVVLVPEPVCGLLALAFFVLLRKVR